VWAERGYTIPFFKDFESIPWEEMKAKYKVPPLVEECYVNAEKYKVKAEVPCTGWNVPPSSVNEVLYKNVGRMLIKEISPEQFLSFVQDAWEIEKAKGMLWQP